MQRPKNLGLKIASVFFAIVLSYFVNSEGGASVVSYTFPIEFQNIPEKQIMLSSTAKQVDVTISGPSFIVSKLLSESRSLKVRIPDGVVERYVFEVDADDLGLPPTISIVSVEPREVEVLFDERVTRDIPVVVPSIGSVGMNYRITDLSISPNQVTVVGPKSELDGITRVETFPIDLRGITSGTAEELRIRSPSAKVTLSASSVKVSVKVSAVERERRFNRLAIEIREAEPEGISLVPSVASVVVVGPSELVQKLLPEQIVPYIRVGAGESDSPTRQVLVDVPEGIVISVVEPEGVKIGKVNRVKAPSGKNKR